MKNGHLKILSEENFGELPKAQKWALRNIVLKWRNLTAVDEDPKARSALKHKCHLAPRGPLQVDEDPKARSALKHVSIYHSIGRLLVDEDPKARSALKLTIAGAVEVVVMLMKTPKHEVH